MCVSSSSSAVGRGHRRSSAILLSLSALLLLFSFFSSSTFPPSPSACVRLCGRMWSECGLWGRESSWSTVPRISLPHYPALIHGDDTVFIIVVYAELRLHSESLSDLSLHESDSIHTFSYVWDFTAEWVRDWDSYHKFLCSRLLSQQYQCIVQQRSIILMLLTLSLQSHTHGHGPGHSHCMYQRIMVSQTYNIICSM